MTNLGGTLYVLCLRHVGPGIPGPRPVSQAELRAAFEPNGGRSIVAIDPDTIETNFDPPGTGLIEDRRR